MNQLYGKLLLLKKWQRITHLVSDGGTKFYWWKENYIYHSSFIFFILFFLAITGFNFHLLYEDEQTFEKKKSFVSFFICTINQPLENKLQLWTEKFIGKIPQNWLGYGPGKRSKMSFGRILAENHLKSHGAIRISIGAKLMRIQLFEVTKSS